jgi:pimeloyl-ACP methyl ester carboxylesterase
MARSTGFGRRTRDHPGVRHGALPECGEGPPIVFVHGLLVNADLWRHITPALRAAGIRCLAPDWPLGSHEVPVPRADLSPPGVANLVADFLDALDFRNAILVANDTGGAITKLLMVQRPQRIGRAHPRCGVAARPVAARARAATIQETGTAGVGHG